MWGGRKAASRDRTRGVPMSVPETSLRDPVDQVSSSQQDVYDDGYLRIEHNGYYMACGGQQLRLPRTEFLIMSRLARTPQRVVPALDLWQYAWGKNKPLNSESLHVYIYRLRNKLLPYQLRIDTMINVGYRLLTRVPGED